MTALKSAAPDSVITGKAAVVSRIRVALRGLFPWDAADVVDLWRLPGDMFLFAVRSRGDSETAPGVKGMMVGLAYMDEDLSEALHANGFTQKHAIDLWHAQFLHDVTDDNVRQVCQTMAQGVADGALEAEPIKPADRAVWEVAIATAASVVSRVRQTADLDAVVSGFGQHPVRPIDANLAQMTERVADAVQRRPIKDNPQG